jgi:methylmalonyl-CoA/ethylmalonyl-CoA epimerase
MRNVTPVKSVHHIGIAVHSIDATRSYYETTLGADFEGVEAIPDQKVRVAFLRIKDIRIELLEPTDTESVVARFLDRRGEGLHHVAYAVADIEAQIAELQQAGFEMIDTVPRIGAHGRRIAFVHPASTFGVLTEFCEERPSTQLR